MHAAFKPPVKTGGYTQLSLQDISTEYKKYLFIQYKAPTGRRHVASGFNPRTQRHRDWYRYSDSFSTRSLSVGCEWKSQREIGWGYGLPRLSLENFIRAPVSGSHFLQCFFENASAANSFLREIMVAGKPNTQKKESANITVRMNLVKYGALVTLNAD